MQTFHTLKKHRFLDCAIEKIYKKEFQFVFFLVLKLIIKEFLIKLKIPGSLKKIQFTNIYVVFFCLFLFLFCLIFIKTQKTHLYLLSSTLLYIKFRPCLGSPPVLSIKLDTTFCTSLIAVFNRFNLPSPFSIVAIFLVCSSIPKCSLDLFQKTVWYLQYI